MDETTPIQTSAVYATNDMPWTHMGGEGKSTADLPHVRAVLDQPEPVKNLVFHRLMDLMIYGVTPTPEVVYELVSTARKQYDTDEAVRVEAETTRTYRPAREGENQVVYYLAFADRVKIGTTSNLARRLEVIPYDEVLGTEPGGYALERLRHQQFAEAKVNREWFSRTPDLMAHIATLTA